MSLNDRLRRLEQSLPMPVPVVFLVVTDPADREPVPADDDRFTFTLDFTRMGSQDDAEA